LYDITASASELRDVLLYASHPDPQLKGNTGLIIGNFITRVLTEGRGNFYTWIKQKNVHQKGKGGYSILPYWT